MIKELKESYGGLLENELIAEIEQVGTFKEIPEGHMLMDIGQYIKGMPLLISGAIKVLREDQNGDELLLYYLEKGDTCSMTMTCFMGDTRSKIRAIAETQATLIMVPFQKIEEWMVKYKSWRNFIFDSYHNRLDELLQTLDSIAFDRMDIRLTDYLKEKARVNNANTIKITHQEIAYDLHSSRVVISRLLKKLEQMHKIKLHRNAIEILEV